MVTVRATEAGHWYTLEGVPMHTVEAKKGGRRATNIRDARALNLVPSVTTIIGTLAKPGLNIWLQKQVLLAALTLPRIMDEPENIYINRIMEDSKAQGRAAADEGTKIHASIQQFYERGHPPTDDIAHINGCSAALIEAFGDRNWEAEKAFASPIGFGGKSDLSCPEAVVDVKTKEFSDPKEVTGFDEHLMQLAAYRFGLGYPEARCANVFVSRSVPGLAVVKEWSEEDISRGWEMFKHLLAFWHLRTEFTK